MLTETIPRQQPLSAASVNGQNGFQDAKISISRENHSEYVAHLEILKRPQERFIQMRLSFFSKSSLCVLPQNQKSPVSEKIARFLTINLTVPGHSIEFPQM